MRLREHRFARLLCAQCPPFVASLVISFTFVACHPASPTAPVVPSPAEDAQLASGASDPCPGFDEACAAGRALLESECPADGDYKKPGDYKKCRRKALDDYLNGLSSCFSQPQLNEIRRCVLRSLPPADPSSLGAAGKTRYHSDE